MSIPVHPLKKKSPKVYAHHAPPRIQKVQELGVTPPCVDQDSRSKDSRSWVFPWLSLSWQGGLWKILSSACFACVNGLVRSLSGGAPSLVVDPLPYHEIAFLQNTIGVLILCPWFLKGGIKSLKTPFPFYQFLYVTFAVLGLLLWYGALYYMPLAHAVALGFTGPVLTILGCRIFLKEPLTPLRLGAIFLSIIGAFVIMRPDKALLTGEGLTAELGLYSLLPLLSAMAWVGSKLAGRVLASRGTSARSLTLCLLVFMAPISFIPTVPVWVTPTLPQMLWIGILGVLACLAHVTMIRAYALAEVSFLMPFGFMRLLLSGMIGYFAFGEMPQTLGVWIGMAVILISLMLLGYEKKASQSFRA